jgi:predicted outer membrane repeat protein
VTVNSGATFTLNKNATLCNANSSALGAALNTFGVTNLYGTISNNKGRGNAAGLYVNTGAVVTCQNATFSGNDTTGNVQNGGAVYVNTNGTFIDNGSSYIGNKGKNGGAIFTGQKGASVLIENATFENNQATANGAAIYANGGTLTVRNSTFTGNAKTDGSAVDTLKKGNGTLHIGVNVVVDGITQTVTEPAT